MSPIERNPNPLPARVGHSFVIRIWIEPRELPNSDLECRGMIQDVATGERQYFKVFDEMIAFMLLQISRGISRIGGSQL